MLRNLSWENCINIRDLGGLRKSSGSSTRWKSIVRADSLDRLTEDGWSELHGYGIRTVIDLRVEREIDPNRLPAPADVTRIFLPLEDQDDGEFWNQWRQYNGTPLYYEAFLKHAPERVSAVFLAIAGAAEGGIVFHCGSGRDRTGLIAILLLQLAGVVDEEIVSDYELSAPNLKVPGREKDEKAIALALAKHQTTASKLVHELLFAVDAADYLRGAGMTREQLDKICGRLA
jgi:protein-tyrosine phosphatase